MPGLSQGEKLALEKLVKRVFWTRFGVYENYTNRWDKGLFSPSDEELKNLENHQKNLEEGGRIDEEIDEYIRESPSLRGEFQQKRKEAKETKKILDKLLQNDKYRQRVKLLDKISELKRKIERDPNNQDYKRELSEFEEELKNLKDIPQKEEKDQNDFPTKLVVGIGIGVVVILLIVFLFSRFNRRN